MRAILQLLCYIVQVHCSGVATSSQQAERTLAHSFIFTVALWADDRCGRALVNDVGVGLADDSVLVLSTSSWWLCIFSVFSCAVTLSSKGYSLVTGRLVSPVAVRSFTARTIPSHPVIRSSITPIFQVVRGVSSWISTTSPVLTDVLLLPVAL